MRKNEPFYPTAKFSKIENIHGVDFSLLSLSSVVLLVSVSIVCSCLSVSSKQQNNRTAAQKISLLNTL